MVAKDLRPSKSTIGANNTKQNIINERWGWYARAGRRKVNKMNKNKQKKSIWEIEMLCRSSQKKTLSGARLH